ncbi:nad dependent epimerase [Moniliophthora roreri MCA 2997]|uniref:Nad dependent epimerase n=1 Tax=Moniliophthora roreri (strain MCA 2997) TaxID=1381753 RepID=V2YE05_MONRO|nr:nad dependent epimerase [Moniliophthora roreri MCA 2997]
MPRLSQQLLKSIQLTGASGFIGGHIARLLLDKGYHVRALARPHSITSLRNAFKGSTFDVVEISDLCGELHQSIFEGVFGVVHVASPLPARASFDIMLKVSIDGSLNILRRAYAAGVRKFVYTSSSGAAWHGGVGPCITGEDWNPITVEEARESGDEVVQYTATKTLAEKAVWKFVEDHRDFDMDVTTILPPLVYGPLTVEQTETLSKKAPDYNALSTDLFVYNLLAPNGVFPPHPRFIAVGDLAELHVRALESRPSTYGRKRLVIAAPDAVDFEECLTLIQNRWPKLEQRLNRRALPVYEDQIMKLEFDYQRTEEVTGLRKSEFQCAQKTLMDTVTSLLSVENSWKLNGHDVIEIPPPFEREF